MIQPSAIELEEAVIGALLIDRDAFIEVSDILTKETFYKEEHGIIYEAISWLYNNAQKVDILTVANRLKETDKLAKVGGLKKISQLTDKVGSSAHVLEHAQIIAQMFMKRRISQIGTDLAMQALEESTDAFELLPRAESALKSISNQLTDRIETSEVLLKSIVERVQNPDSGVKRTVSLPGINGENNNVNVRVAPGNYVVLAGRPGMGKTAYMCEWIRSELRQNKPVLCFSIEMKSQELFNRLVAAECDIDIYSLETGKLSSEERKRLDERMGFIERWLLLIDDKTADINKIRNISRKYKAKFPNLSLICKDYLQKTRGKDPDNSNANRDQLIGYYSGTGKEIAKELDVVFLDLSQVGRASEKTTSKKPGLADLRESGNIEQDADIVMFVYRPIYYGIRQDENGKDISSQLEIIVDKYRGGVVGNGFCNVDMAKNKVTESNEYAGFTVKGESAINTMRKESSTFDNILTKEEPF